MVSTNSSTSEVYDRLRATGASTVCAVLDMIGCSGTITGLPPVRPGQSFAGPAFTVKASTGPLGSFDASGFDIALYADNAAAGQVIAIDAGGAHVSLAGGIAALASARNGVVAWLVDGGMRDVDELREVPIPIHVRHGIAVTGRTRVHIDQVNGPITIDGVSIEPQDVLVGDSSGVACVPVRHLEKVLRMSEWIDGRDKVARTMVKEGASFAQAFREASAQYTALHGPLEA